MEPFGPAGVGDAVQSAAQLLVGARARKETARQRSIVETGTSDQNREPSPLVDVANSGRRIARVLCGGVDLGRIRDVDEMVRDTTSRLDRELVRADVETAVHGRRIAVDDLPIMPLSQ